MTPRSPKCVIDFDGDRVTVLAAGSDPLLLRRPADVAADDPRAAAEWINRTAREHGVSIRGGVLVTLARREAVLKRFTVTVAENAGTADLDGVIRLQITRQLAGPVEDPVVDFRILRDATEGAGGRRVLVLAGGIPATRLAFLRELAKTAGWKLQGVTLRCFDTAERLIDDAHAAESGAAASASLGVTLEPGAIELVLADPTGLVAARSLELAADADLPPEEIARQVAVEAKRTWVSYRAASDSLEVRRVRVFGRQDIAERISGTVKRTLGIDQGANDDAEHDSEQIAPASAAGFTASPQRSLDFTHPAAPPDPAATRRQASLLGVFVLIVLIGGGWVLANAALGDLRAQLDAAKKKEQSLRADVQSHLVLKGRYEHLRAWLGSRTSWLEHFDAVLVDLPDPPGAIITRISGLNLPQSNGRDVRYVSKGDLPMQGDWVRDRTVRMNVQGRAPSPAAVAAIRAAYLARGIYRVGTGRADGEPVFDFDLTSPDPRPDLTPGSTEDPS